MRRSRARPPRPSPGERMKANLHRLRQENVDLRRILELYEEAVRQLTLENTALRRGATVLVLPARSRPDPAIQS